MEKVKDFMTDPATTKNNQAKLGFKFSLEKLPVLDDTTDRFLGIWILTFEIMFFSSAYTQKKIESYTKQATKAATSKEISLLLYGLNLEANHLQDVSHAS